jgi:hypothetical protein
LLPGFSPRFWEFLDFLPFYPILMLSIAFLLVGLGDWISSKTTLPAYLIPILLVSWEIFSNIQAHPLFEQTNQRRVQLISDTLRLTRPEESVLDAKGQVWAAFFSDSLLKVYLSGSCS